MMKVFTRKDPQAPESLKTLQYWFGSVLRKPVGFDVTSIAEEASRYVLPSTLKPHQRVEIYNQQYWYRLLSALHQNFPLVTRIFGHYLFNEQIGIPFLQDYPPTHWSLNTLGRELPDWIKSHYKEEDAPFVYDCAVIDWIYQESFLSPREDLTLKDPEAILEAPLKLQKHVHLMHLPYNLLSFRQQMIKKRGTIGLSMTSLPSAEGKRDSILSGRTRGARLNGFSSLKMNIFVYKSCLEASP